MTKIHVMFKLLNGNRFIVFTILSLDNLLSYQVYHLLSI